MKRLALLIFLVVGIHAVGQAQAKTAKSPDDLIPAGSVVTQKIQGDLNKDDQPDYVFILKGTDKNKIVKDERGGESDRNRRGVLVVLSTRNGYELALDNRSCFYSENEDGGVYYAPDLDVDVNQGNLRIDFLGGRYGYEHYIFRYQNANFELIGYDSSEDRGPIVERTVSINFVTRKIRMRENVNPHAEDEEQEKFKETWKRFTLSKPILLKNIAHFEDLNVYRIVGLE